MALLNLLKWFRIFQGPRSGWASGVGLSYENGRHVSSGWRAYFFFGSYLFSGKDGHPLEESDVSDDAPEAVNDDPVESKFEKKQAAREAKQRKKEAKEAKKKEKAAAKAEAKAANAAKKAKKKKK